MYEEKVSKGLWESNIKNVPMFSIFTQLIKRTSKKLDQEEYWS